MKLRQAVVLSAVLALFAVAVSSVAAIGFPPSKHGKAGVTLRIYLDRHGREAVEGPNFAVQPNVPVSVRFVNYTRRWHTFTIPALHVAAMVPPRRGAAPRVTRTTFTASKFGVFDWYCVFCREGSHRAPHEMGGKVYAIIEPSGD